MEGAVWAVVGLIVLVLLVSFVLTLPNFVEISAASAFRSFYEEYVDDLVVSITAALSLFAVATAFGTLIAKGTAKDLYIFGALFIVTVKSVLLFLDVALNTPETWLVTSVAHLIDLLAIVFLVLALRETC